ncbi:MULTISPECIES: DUF4142 domain-containing protein [unclassified Sinorhizobium]|uniref:DUF4142 domain-containing protein n=1 Tax=unclassified Sinorhizobium TaxID=2613772 RepID=UPI00352624CC
MGLKLMLAGAVLAIGCFVAASAMAESDKQFLSNAIKTDNAEIALGELAVQKGASDGVRSFGQTLVDDHRKAKAEAAALTADLEAKVSGNLTEDAQRELDKLKGMTGPEFDKEFVSFMVSAHEKDIAAFKEKAGEGNRPVPVLAGKALPMLQRHLELAQSLNAH